MKLRLPVADELILAARMPKHVVDPYRPYSFLIEQECQPSRKVEDVAVLLLTNRECPFHCLMCDLWKNTTDEPVPVGAIPAQIDFALNQLPNAQHIKLYNSGNFFDPLAIPPEDYAAIAVRVKAFNTVIVENHPAMCGGRVPRFLAALSEIEAATKLEVALGLETIHPTVLPLLNKQMTTDLFRCACEYLRSLNVFVRAFLLLRPPTLSEQEGLDWALRSMEFAFDCGVQTVSVIPTRGGNGIMEQLQSQMMFTPPSLESLESVLTQGLALGRGRVFVDLWDADQLASGTENSVARISRLKQMNLCQRFLPQAE